MLLHASRDPSASLQTQRQVGRCTFDDVWPDSAWQKLCTSGVTRWTIPTEYGGDGRPPDEWLDGSIELARGDLLTAFIFSQYQAACQRIAVAPSQELKQRWLPELAAGKKFATVGISHLTTSRQHTAPTVTAKQDGDAYHLNGEVPWVTVGARADVVVTGGTLNDGRQILAAIPTDRSGIDIGQPLELLALSGSETGSITLTDMAISANEIIAGPVERVVQHAGGGGAGSLMTSALAVGHAFGCLDLLQQEAASRASLEPILQSLSSKAIALRLDLLQAARQASLTTAETLRAQSTDLALRSSQSLLTAAKGAGFVAGHPAEVLCRQAMFFLVWSCPQPVANQLLQNFSGCEK